MRRRTLGIVVLATVVVAAVATWLASALIASPAEVAARTAPPEPTPILVPVEERVLATKVVSRGTAHYGSARSVALARSGLKEGARLITRLPSVDSSLREGDVVLTVSGRPTFLFDGAEPSYRDLGPGMEGRDVRQLELALRRLGFSPRAVDGYYDAATGAAVAALYRDHGFEPVIATEAQLQRVRPVEAELVSGGLATAGIQFPSDEVVFVPNTPLRVSKVAGGVGEAPPRPVLTVTGSVVVVDGLLPVEDAKLVRQGADVVVDEPALGLDAKGTVTRVAAQPGTDGADAFHVAFEVLVRNPPRGLVGASVRLTVPTESTKTAELAVPVSALSLGPDGGARVQRSEDGRLEFVPVAPGLSADGYVAITPRGGRLAAGDLVAVGFENRPKAGG